MSVCIHHVGFLCLEFVFLLQFLSFVCLCVCVGAYVVYVASSFRRACVVSCEDRKSLFN